MKSPDDETKWITASGIPVDPCYHPRENRLEHEDPAIVGEHADEGQRRAQREEADLEVQKRVGAFPPGPTRDKHADHSWCFSRNRRTPSMVSPVMRARTFTSAPRAMASSKERPSMP